RELEDLAPDLLAAPDPQAASRILVEGTRRCLLARRHAEQLVAELYAFGRRIAQTQDAADLHALLLETMATRVRALQAGLALYDEATGRLSIVATRGYPAVLVEDLRIAPGEGVIGQVFLSRRPLLVTDASRERPGPPRLRYRTGSFIALPLFTGTTGLGVLTLADREDLQPFSRSDLTVARALTAPATLGLAAARIAAHNRALAHAAAVDPLTGLFNRRYFETRIDEEIQRARRHGLDLALLVIDADDFKLLNDRLGHLVGDQVLRAMADTLRRSVRGFDVCTRFGGEEFAILMPGSNAAAAVQSAERIRGQIAGYRFDAPIPPDIHPTISVGVAVLAPGHTANDLIARADRALYRAKAEGKNRVRLGE
ncbi:MAG TPA: sensor domain-containing diguanylate cyclase, partial [Vicinamibacterales bacterium]|nr:sensor domain-containing diguanylate cyclase [Vicinamibacterales bacterium]